MTAADPNAPLPAGDAAGGRRASFGVPYPGTATPDAPVLEIWEDFQCPACGAVEQNAGGNRRHAGRQRRQIQLIWRPTTFLDKRISATTASSARATAAWGCAIDAGKAKEYQDPRLRQTSPSRGRRLDRRAAARLRRARGHHRRRPRPPSHRASPTAPTSPGRPTAPTSSTPSNIPGTPPSRSTARRSRRRSRRPGEAREHSWPRRRGGPASDPCSPAGLATCVGIVPRSAIDPQPRPGRLVARDRCRSGLRPARSCSASSWRCWSGDRRYVARGGEPGVITTSRMWAVPFGIVGGAALPRHLGRPDLLRCPTGLGFVAALRSGTAAWASGAAWRPRCLGGSIACRRAPGS